ncbi:MAG: threonine-phosphate decarboxylase [Mangrovibacterium sp.]
MITGHGDDRYQYPDIRINFSSNVNPNGINSHLTDHLKDCMTGIGSYPEPLAQHVAERIGQKRNLPEGSVLVTNGSVEAFYLTAALLTKKRSLVYTPSFSEYADACRAFGHELLFSDNSSFPDVSLDRIDAVWICNPNNPDGKYFDIQMLQRQIEQHPATLFIIDEAYLDFMIEKRSLAEDAGHLQNLVVISSFTKRYAMPGLRLGYLVSHPDRVREIQKQVMPWRISTLAIEAGLFCLSEKYRDEFRIQELLNESKRVQAAINRINGFRVHPSETLFFLVEGPVKAAVLKQKLARDHQILIRDASNFRGLSAVHFRISIQSPEENNILINILDRWK